MRNDGQRGIHRCGTARRDGSQRTKEACQQRCAQKGDSLAHKVGYEGYGAQFDTAIFGKKDARQRIIGKATTDSKTIGNGALQHQEGNGSARPRPQDGGQRRGLSDRNSLFISGLLPMPMPTHNNRAHRAVMLTVLLLTHCGNTSARPHSMPAAKKATIIRLPFMPWLLRYV